MVQNSTVRAPPHRSLYMMLAPTRRLMCPHIRIWLSSPWARLR